jgi:two-component system response regulator PilR (NtrC family)
MYIPDLRLQLGERMNQSVNILLVEDMASFRGAVSQLLSVYSDVDEAQDVAEAKQALQKKTYDVVILDKELPDGSGIDLISVVKDHNANAVVIMLTSDTEFGSVKHSISRGADDYVIKTENVVPDLLVRIPIAISKMAASRKLRTLEATLAESLKYEIVGKSPSTCELRELVSSLKGTRSHVLIAGESGTGKELIARRLNAIESDSKRPFVAVNCGAIPENLVESELFGHKKGSFTGAVVDRIGKFEHAHEGDLFLDEIGELPLSAQVKLLRVIQEGELTRVGDERVIRVKCRIIAATNKNLQEMVKAGSFREDLFHRLNVVGIETTPLRNRISDLPDIAKLLLLQIGGPTLTISNSATRALQDLTWPGNVRELRNTIERAILAARRRGSSDISYDDVVLQEPSTTSAMRKLNAELPSSVSDLTPENYQNFVLSVEREYLLNGLQAVKGNHLELARRLDISRATLFRRLSVLGIGQNAAGPTATKVRPGVRISVNPATRFGSIRPGYFRSVATPVSA